ncbi:MAG: hypothetical protein RBR30_02755 [Tenuifilaceae bacterium]|nr:hypothetical protein [Tenuifilaceae bacterium]
MNKLLKTVALCVIASAEWIFGNLLIRYYQNDKIWNWDEPSIIPPLVVSIIAIGYTSTQIFLKKRKTTLNSAE